MSGLSIGSAFTLTGNTASQALKVTGAVDVLKIDTSGRTYYPEQIGFIAGLSTDPGWITQTSAAWNIQNFFDTTTYNKGGGFASSRFTAPVTGNYIFHFHSYLNKTTAVQGTYYHPHLWVNGQQNAGNICFRHKGHFTSTGYSLAGEIVEMMYLTAGDYVDPYIYASAGGLQVYRYYSMFSGFLVG